MRLLPLSCLVAAGLAVALPAAAATRAPSSATVTIVIPAFPAASVAAAIKKAMRSMPNIQIVQHHTNAVPKMPPGVLKFSPNEVNRSTNAQIGKIVTLYPATLPNGRKGHLIVVHFPRNFSSRVTSVVQPDSKAFTLHTGERVVLMRSTITGWSRVPPYNGPKFTPPQKK